MLFTSKPANESLMYTVERLKGEYIYIREGEKVVICKLIEISCGRALEHTHGWVGLGAKASTCSTDVGLE